MDAEVDGTPWSPDDLRQRLMALQPTLVFALLGTTRGRERESRRAGKPAENYEAVDYGLTAMLRRASAAVRPAPRFVYLSSAGVRDDTRNAYLRARWRAESEIRASGTPFTIARPSFITGAGRDEPRPLERAAALIVDAGLAVAGLLGARRLRDRWRSTDNLELARALVRLARDPRADGAVVHGELLR